MARSVPTPVRAHGPNVQNDQQAVTQPRAQLLQQTYNSDLGRSLPCLNPRQPGATTLQQMTGLTRRHAWLP